MTPDDWWTRLVYEDPTPVAEMRANHMSKLHISTARHLADKHGHRYEAQVPLPDMQALHHDLHGGTTNYLVTAHPHAAMY